MHGGQVGIFQGHCTYGYICPVNFCIEAAELSSKLCT